MTVQLAPRPWADCGDEDPLASAEADVRAATLALADAETAWQAARERVMRDVPEAEAEDARLRLAQRAALRRWTLALLAFGTRLDARKGESRT